MLTTIITDDFIALLIYSKISIKKIIFILTFLAFTFISMSSCLLSTIVLYFFICIDEDYELEGRYHSTHPLLYKEASQLL